MNTKIKNIAKVGLTALIMSQALFVSTASADISAPTVEMAQTTYKTMKIEGLDIFYREAGSPSNPTLLLLHGFPTSSHMFRKLIPELSEQYHVIAPDYPGYGNSSMPSVDEFDYTFDHMASIVEQLLNKKKIEKATGCPSMSSTTSAKYSKM